MPLVAHVSKTNLGIFNLIFRLSDRNNSCTSSTAAGAPSPSEPVKEVCRPNWTKGKNKKTQKIWDSEARIRIPGPVFTNLENDEVVVDHVQIPQLIKPISWNLFFLRSPDNILELPSMVSIF